MAIVGLDWFVERVLQVVALEVLVLIFFSFLDIFIGLLDVSALHFLHEGVAVIQLLDVVVEDVGKSFVVH